MKAKATTYHQHQPKEKQSWHDTIKTHVGSLQNGADNATSAAAEFESAAQDEAFYQSQY